MSQPICRAEFAGGEAERRRGSRHGACWHGRRSAAPARAPSPMTKLDRRRIAGASSGGRSGGHRREGRGVVSSLSRHPILSALRRRDSAATMVKDQAWIIRRRSSRRVLAPPVRCRARRRRSRGCACRRTCRRRPRAAPSWSAPARPPAPMAQGGRGPLAGRRSTGLVVTRYGHGVPCRRIEVVEAGHPVPDAAGARRRRAHPRARSAASSADDLVLCLHLGRRLGAAGACRRRG